MLLKCCYMHLISCIKFNVKKVLVMEFEFGFVDVGMSMLALLMFGALIQTQMQQEWQSTSGLLLISFAGIPLGFALIALMINIPWLFIGAAVFAGIHSSKTK